MRKRPLHIDLKDSELKCDFKAAVSKLDIDMTEACTLFAKKLIKHPQLTYEFIKDN